MTKIRRLSSLEDVSGAARRPSYDPGKHGWGIVHLGVSVSSRASSRLLHGRGALG
jgi:fructuronate reductase